MSSPSSATTLAPAPIRPAVGVDAHALFALSAPFIRSGALRRRSVADYRTAAADFLVSPGPAGLLGCVALGGLPDGAAVLYNFCVHGARQGTGLGSALLDALLHRADGRPLYTATTGSARLFHHYGFTEIPARLAPPGWAAGLDPARNSRVYLRT
ncbi:GNAT family N-acetyltransferase [Kitasatospora sp. NPDC002040]|uniref:GNAT family N-acetyltransferase n=1 Tax=Kitasatospora sp. NPDC002040 TaxID=3154661 RepID=UPI00331EAA4E